MLQVRPLPRSRAVETEAAAAAATERQRIIVEEREERTLQPPPQMHPLRQSQHLHPLPSQRQVGKQTNTLFFFFLQTTKIILFFL